MIGAASASDVYSKHENTYLTAAAAGEPQAAARTPAATSIEGPATRGEQLCSRVGVAAWRLVSCSSPAAALPPVLGLLLRHMPPQAGCQRRQSCMQQEALEAVDALHQAVGWPRPAYLRLTGVRMSGRCCDLLYAACVGTSVLVQHSCCCCCCLCWRQATRAPAAEGCANEQRACWCRPASSPAGEAFIMGLLQVGRGPG